MTKLLEKAIEAARRLPDAEQDALGALLLELAAEEPSYRLTEEQIEGVVLAIGAVERGEIASEEDVRKVFGRTIG